MDPTRPVAEVPSLSVYTWTPLEPAAWIAAVYTDPIDVCWNLYDGSEGYVDGDCGDASWSLSDVKPAAFVEVPEYGDPWEYADVYLVVADIADIDEHVYHFECGGEVEELFVSYGDSVTCAVAVRDSGYTGITSLHWKFQPDNGIGVNGPSISGPTYGSAWPYSPASSGQQGAMFTYRGIETEVWVHVFVSYPCGGSVMDGRDTIRAEYAQYSLTVPACNDFASSGGSTHFTWSELNGGFSSGNPHSPWGIVTSGLTSGLEGTRTNYNRGGITLTSGYRCPHGNNAVGGVTNSYHMLGRAADMFSAEYSWTQAEFALLKAAADSTHPVESLNWSTYTDHHFHAAW